MRVVSNTSPLFYLSTIGKLDLIRQLYDEITIPVTVFNEITDVGNTDPSARIVPTLSWIKVQSAIDVAFVNNLRAELDPGEAEAIALAIELSADRLLMDERLARTAAMQVGLQVTVVLGILIAAKRNKLIEDVKPLVDALIKELGFWIDARLYAEVLRSVGELD